MRRARLVVSIGEEMSSQSTDSATTATVAEEEYLQILFWLQEAGLPMTGANVARAMQLSAPTVHEMVGRLERDGYITRARDRTIAFTPTGAEHAEGIVRRHRLIERFLTDVLKIPWDEVHEEAERLDSDVTGAREPAARGDRRRKDVPPRPPDRRRCAPSPAYRSPTSSSARSVRDPALRERGRGPPALPEELGPQAGLGGAWWVARDGEQVVVEVAAGHRCAVTPSVAETVSVIADPSPPSRTALPEQLVLGQRYGR